MVNVTDIIKSSGLTITENRKRVLALFYLSSHVLSLKEVESSVSDMDRVTLYRTLKSFVEKGLIHKISDGTKHPKYAISYKHSPQGEHAHFHCTACEKTICLNKIIVPEISDIPKGYQIQQTNLVISGVCEACT